MAEYKEVIKQFNRMCEASGACVKCPLYKPRGLKTCWQWTFAEPEKAEELIMQWVKEHPIITNADKFKEIFGYKPNYMPLFSVSSSEWLRSEYKEPKNE